MLENKNLLIAIVLSIAILLGFQLIYGVPTVDNKQSQNSKLESQNLQSLSENNLDPKITNKLKTKGNNVSDSETYIKREKIISETDRVKIKSEKLIGSIQLEGALFDDLTLIKYGENIEKNSDRVIFLSPKNSLNPYYASFGWIQQNKEDCIKNNSSSECEKFDYIELPNKKTI